MVQTLKKTVEVPQLQFLDELATAAIDKARDVLQSYRLGGMARPFTSSVDLHVQPREINRGSAGTDARNARVGNGPATRGRQSGGKSVQGPQESVWRCYKRCAG